MSHRQTPLERAHELHKSMKNLQALTDDCGIADGLGQLKEVDDGIRAALKKAGADLTALYAQGSNYDARNPNPTITLKEAEARYKEDQKQAQANLADKFIELAKGYKEYLHGETNHAPNTRYSVINHPTPDGTEHVIKHVLAEATKLGKPSDLTTLYPGLTLPESQAAFKQAKSHALVRDAIGEKYSRDREIGVDYKGEGRFGIKTVDPMIKRALVSAGYPIESNPIDFVEGKLDPVNEPVSMARIPTNRNQAKGNTPGN